MIFQSKVESRKSKVEKSKVASGPPERAILSNRVLRAAEPLMTFDLPTFRLLTDDFRLKHP
jgi:hypothetical protein